MEIGLKVQVLRKVSINSEIAFVSHLIIPKGSSGISSGAFETVNKIAICHSINESLAIGYNLGYDYSGAGKET